MAMSETERSRILKAHSIGPAMVRWLESAGYERLADFRGADPHDIAFRIATVPGNPRLNGNGIAALRNLVALADESD